MKRAIIIFLALLGVVVTVFFISLIHHQGSMIYIRDFKNVRDNLGWTIKDDYGFNKDINLPVRERKMKGDRYTLIKKAEQSHLDSECIGFFAFAKKVRFYINEKPVKEFGFKDIYKPYRHSAGSRYYIVQLPKIKIGDEIKIDIWQEQELYQGNLKEILLGSESSIYLEVILTHGLSFGFSILLFMLGLVSIAINIWARKKIQSGPMTLFLGLTTIACAFWLVSENPILTMLIPNQPLKNTITFLSVMIVPIPLIIYAENTNAFSSNCMTRLFTLMFTINAVLTFALQYFNILDFTYSVTSYHILVFAFLPYVCYKVITYLKKKAIKRKILFISTSLILIVGGTITLIILYINREVRIEPVQFATILLIGIVITDNIHYIFESLTIAERERIFELMATKDYATGAFSRNAYLKQINTFKEEEDFMGIILVDLDNLKYINDNYGHIMGDEFINLGYKIMTKVFSDKIYRIGGDEFIVFKKDRRFKEIEAIIQKFQKELDKERETVTYPLGASIGYSIWDITSGQKYEDALLKADKQMYRYKQKNKKVFPKGEDKYVVEQHIIKNHSNRKTDF